MNPVAEPVALAQAFLEARPASAARALESLEPADAAALIELVPVRISSPALGRMTPWAAAQCLARVQTDRAGAILDQLQSPEALAILRQMPKERRHELLGVLPEELARHYRRTLTYPASQVGAWIDHDVAAVEQDRTVGDALGLLRARRQSDDSVIFVVDNTRRYLGVVFTPALLHLDRGVQLAAAAERQVHPIPDTASLAAVVNDPVWASTLLLPVVNRHGELLGGLKRANLDKARLAERVTGSPSTAPLLLYLLEAYVVVLAGLAHVPVASNEDTEWGYATRAGAHGR